MDAPVTVIIATLGDERRANTIFRAIDSVQRSGVVANVIVVVNGNRFSPALLERLRSAPGVQCEQLAVGSLPLSLKHGRSLVTTEFFAFLDDDDEVLDDALRVRLDVLRANPHLAFVATNGLWHLESGWVPRVTLSAARIEADPLGSLLIENWMTSASGLYRSSLVPTTVLDGMPPYLEWAYLAFKLASRVPFRFLDAATFRLHDTQGSLSKTDGYFVGIVVALERILQLPLSSAIRAGLRRRLGAAHHTLSMRRLETGDMAGAWRHHCLSLIQPGRSRYVLYTRKFCLPRRAASRSL
jgi:hypothetical protein